MDNNVRGDRGSERVGWVEGVKGKKYSTSATAQTIKKILGNWLIPVPTYMKLLLPVVVFPEKL